MTINYLLLYKDLRFFPILGAIEYKIVKIIFTKYTKESYFQMNASLEDSRLYIHISVTKISP